MVFVQSLRAESAQATPGESHTAAFLWDLSNHYEHFSHELLWRCGTRRSLPKEGHRRKMRLGHDVRTSILHSAAA